MDSSSSGSSPTVRPQGVGYGSGSGSQSGAYSTAAAPPPGFIPGNPTDPFPPTPTPFHPGNPTDPFPRPTPIAPVREAAPALMQQADEQSAALTASMQSILDELASTIGQTAAQSKATLQQITAALRAELKVTSGQQNAMVQQAIEAVANAVTSGANMNQAVLDGIVSNLAAVPAAQVTTAGTTTFSPVGGLPAPLFTPALPVGTGTGQQTSPGSFASPAPTPTPVQPTPIQPTPTPTPTQTQTAGPIPPIVIIQPNPGGGQPGTPQASCMTCGVYNAQGVWQETFNNLTSGQAAILTQQVGNLGQGYTVQCKAQTQPCGPALGQPIFIPPGGAAPQPPQPAAPPPCGLNQPLDFTCDYLLESFYPAFPQYQGWTAQQITNDPGAWSAIYNWAAKSPGGVGILSACWQCGTGTAPPPPTPTPTQTQTPPPTPTPTKPPSTPPATPGCDSTVKATLSMQNIDKIGSQNWCQNIDAIAGSFEQVGKAAVEVFKSSAPTGGQLAYPLNATLSSALALIPFGIGQAVVSGANWLICLWNKFAADANWGFASAVAITSAVTCNKPGLMIGLCVVQGLLRSMEKLRVGWDGGVWATLDIHIEFDAANAAIEYLMRYSCPYGIPDPSTCMMLYRGGWISLGTYQCWMGMNNCDTLVWQPVFDASRPRPNVQERQQLLWRQRPGNNNGGPKYTDAMFQSDLAVDGTHPAWNDLLYATRYTRYTIRELRQLMDAGVLTQEDAFHVFQDMGFDDAKATTLAKMEQVLTVRRREQEIMGYTPAKISQLFMRGVMQGSEVTTAMQSLSYTPAQASTLMEVASKESHAQQVIKMVNRAENDLLSTTEVAYKIGRISADAAKAALSSLGSPDNVATAIVSTWDAAAGNDLTKQAVASVKKGWRSGFLPTVQVVDMLQSAGMIPNKANELLSLWQLEVQVDERVEDVSQILSSVSSGNMDAATAGARLANMGWATADSDILVSEAVQRLAKAQGELEGKALAAEERAQKAAQSASKAAKAAAERAAAQSAKAAETLAKQALTAQKTARAALLKATPVSKLAKWLRDGMISQEAFIARMILLGYPEESAALQAEEACHGKGAACVPTAGPDDATLQNLPT